MCGISFYCSNKDFLDDELKESLRLTFHRGPDANGTFTERVGKYNVGIGHNRLSIIELSEAGSQPMTSKSGDKATFLL